MIISEDIEYETFFCRECVSIRWNPVVGNGRLEAPGRAFYSVVKKATTSGAIRNV